MTAEERNARALAVCAALLANAANLLRDAGQRLHQVFPTEENKWLLDAVDLETERTAQLMESVVRARDRADGCGPTEKS